MHILAGEWPRVLAGYVVACAVGWAVPAAATSLAIGFQVQEDSLLVPVFFLAVLTHYMALPFMVGLTTSAFWHDSPMAMESREVGKFCILLLTGGPFLMVSMTLIGLFVLPIAVAYWYAYDKAFRWGVENWPHRPWRVLFGLEPMPGHWFKGRKR